MARIRTATVLVNLTAAAAVPSDVFVYEIPVLEAIHGDLDTQLVRVVSESAIDLDISSPADLYAALQAKYGKNGGDVVKSVYPDKRAFERALRASIEDVEADDGEDEKPARTDVKKAEAPTVDGDDTGPPQD